MKFQRVNARQLIDRYFAISLDSWATSGLQNRRRWISPAPKDGTPTIHAWPHGRWCSTKWVANASFIWTPISTISGAMTDPTNSQSLINTRRSAKFVYGPDWSFHDFGRIKPSERPWLDYIFVDRRWTALTCACLSEYYGELFPTDHCPVLVVLSLK